MCNDNIGDQINVSNQKFIIQLDAKLRSTPWSEDFFRTTKGNYCIWGYFSFIQWERHVIVCSLNIILEVVLTLKLASNTPNLDETFTTYKAKCF